MLSSTISKPPLWHIKCDLKHRLEDITIESVVWQFVFLQGYAPLFNSLSFHLGIFIFPLEENSTVVGFEAMISSQIITVQIKDKAKIDDCYLDCCHAANGALQSGSGKSEPRLAKVWGYKLLLWSGQYLWGQLSSYLDPVTSIMILLPWRTEEHQLFVCLTDPNQKNTWSHTNYKGESR